VKKYKEVTETLQALHRLTKKLKEDISEFHYIEEVAMMLEGTSDDLNEIVTDYADKEPYA